MSLSKGFIESFSITLLLNVTPEKEEGIFSKRVDFLQEKKVIRIEKNNLLLQAYGGSNSHWMYFNIEPTLEKLLTLLWWPHKWAIDIFYPMKCKNYACYPFLGEQSDGYSDISHLNRDWSEMYKITRHTMKRQLRQYL